MLTDPSCAGDDAGRPPPKKALQAAATPSTRRHPPHGSSASLENTMSPAAAQAAEHPTWGLVETMDVMADDDLMEDLAKSDEDIRAGRVVSLDDLLNSLEIDAKEEDARAGRVVR